MPADPRKNNCMRQARRPHPLCSCTGTRVCGCRCVASGQTASRASGRSRPYRASSRRAGGSSIPLSCTTTISTSGLSSRGRRCLERTFSSSANCPQTRWASTRPRRPLHAWPRSWEPTWTCCSYIGRPTSTTRQRRRDALRSPADLGGHAAQRPGGRWRPHSAPAGRAHWASPTSPFGTSRSCSRCPGVPRMWLRIRSSSILGGRSTSCGSSAPNAGSA
mmetsp:Transcript_28472/g.81887  ORF Transcript_28472/g.81887 Transcript_28472/m.81887 type:complete len:219 (+) Transcript_28472:1062-1718(+)